MIRVLSILAAVAALAVSAAPASAGWQRPKPAPSITDGTSNTVQVRNAEKGRSAGKVANHTEGTVSVVGDRVKVGLKGIVTNNNDPDTLTLGAVHARGARVILGLSWKYT